MEEKKLTTAEKNKKEDVIKAIAKEKGGKDNLKPVDYAIATDTAKRVAEMVSTALSEDYQTARDMYKNDPTPERRKHMDKEFEKHSKAIDKSPMGKPLPKNELFGNDSLTSDEEEDDFLGVKTKVKEMEEDNDVNDLIYDIRNMVQNFARSHSEDENMQLLKRLADLVKYYGGDLQESEELNEEDDFLGVKTKVKEGEDIEVGHTDNEAHMMRSDLFRIAKYAAELFSMLKKYEDMGEADFPHWWQSKVIKARDYMVSAKHYLDGEENIAQIDAMMDPEMEIDLAEQEEGGEEVKVGSYQTEHFDICPGAVAVYKDIEVEDMDLAERAAKMNDALFAMEKAALADGASETDVFAAQLVADQIMEMAKMMGLEKEHGYVQGHVDKIKGAIGGSEEIEETKIQKLSRMMAEEKYPWEDCIADQEKRYGSKEQAEKVCGAIKAGR